MSACLMWRIQSSKVICIQTQFWICPRLHCCVFVPFFVGELIVEMRWISLSLLCTDIIIPLPTYTASQQVRIGSLNERSTHN